jgi:leucyl aminopeptidase
VVAVPVASGPGGEEIQPRQDTAQIALRYGIDLAEYAERRHFTGGPGTALAIDLPVVHGAAAHPMPWQGLASTVVLAGIGHGSDAELRRAGAAIAEAAAGRGQVATGIGSGETPQAQAAFVEGYLLGAYRVVKRGREATPPPLAGDLRLVGSYDAEALALAQAAAQATWLVRDLTNTPSNIKDPAWLAGQATELAGEAGLDVEVMEAGRLRKEGFGAILAVGQGAPCPPRLVVARYRPSAAGQAEGPHLVLVGKGITFDSGGLDLKRPEGMVTMKTDMAGAATVLAAAIGAARQRLPLAVTAVMPLAQNAFGGGAYRPDDVVRTYSGLTVEVGNTDAEGRMVLADGLAYAVRHLEPDVLVDIATLTGAQRTALGTSVGGLFTDDDALADLLAGAGDASGEAWWRLPLASAYVDQTHSPVADLDNATRGGRSLAAGRPAGAITAALFLRAFTAGAPHWAHLDIAGPGRAAKGDLLITAGATGFGARTLLRAARALAGG